MRTTLDVTIGRIQEPDATRPYSRLVERPGEPHLWRDDLAIFASGSSGAEAGTALAAGVNDAERVVRVGTSSAHGVDCADGVDRVADVDRADGMDRVEGAPGADGVGSAGADGLGLAARLAGARALLRLVHMTDTHVIDASSPARAEFVELAAATDSRWKIMVPMFRPHELLQQHALAAMVDTINSLSVAPVSGDPLDVVIVTGDCVDNAQRNELTAYLALLDGGTVHLPYDGVQSVAAYLGEETVSRGDSGSSAVDFRNADPSVGVITDAVTDVGFWCPDPSVDDYWKRTYGFSSFSGLLEAIDEPIVSVGLKLPWLGVVGNHDWLRQGTAKTSPAMEAIAVGSEKSTGMPPGFLPEDALVAYLEEPFSYNVGAPTRTVRADPERVGITASDFIRAHIESDRGTGRWRAATAATAEANNSGTAGTAGTVGSGDAKGVPGSPGANPVAHSASVDITQVTRGHGFGDEVNVLRPDYVVDFGAVWIIAIDTNHPAGHYQGSVGMAQLEWLEERLVEAKHVYVLLASHHPTEALTNETRAEGFADDRVLADPVAEVLHRHGCVIGWLTGHRHHHRIKAHPDPLGRNPGFWEITTSSIIDWPSQARILEVLQLPDGQIVMASTVLDHHGTIDPGPKAAESLVGLAGAHREIAAANAVQRGESFFFRAPGRPTDRNVILHAR